jgi:hypothetical protein
MSSANMEAKMGASLSTRFVGSIDVVCESCVPFNHLAKYEYRDSG